MSKNDLLSNVPEEKTEEKIKVELTPKQNVVQAVKFALFSISAGLIELAAFTLLNETLDLPYWPCYLTALILSVIYNFTINRRFTFKSAANVPAAMLKIAGFYLVFAPLSTLFGDYLEGIGWNEYIILGITMASNLLLEFLFCRFVVYRNSINTNKLGQDEEKRKELEKNNS